MSNKNKLALEMDRCHRQIAANTAGKNAARNKSLAYGMFALIFAAGLLISKDDYMKRTAEYKDLSESIGIFYAKAADFKGYREDMTDDLRLIADEIETGKVDYSYINQCLANFENVGSNEHIDKYLEENEPEKFEEISTLKDLQESTKDKKRNSLLMASAFGVESLVTAAASIYEISQYLFNKKRLKEENTTLQQLLKEANGASPEPEKSNENKEPEMQ